MASPRRCIPFTHVWVAAWSQGRVIIYQCKRCGIPKMRLKG